MGSLYLLSRSAPVVQSLHARRNLDRRKLRYPACDGNAEVAMTSRDDLVRRALEGGGEAGALIRATDWSKTPVGGVESWPQSLVVALRIVLTSRYAMWLGWGPELT